MAMDCSSRCAPGGFSLPRGPVPALPTTYKLHNKLRYRLTPLLILPQHPTRPSLAISYVAVGQPKTRHTSNAARG